MGASLLALAESILLIQITFQQKLNKKQYYKQKYLTLMQLNV